ncbi:MAG: acyl-CoA synthetase [Acidimicrobiaceae bacterium]|jgi:acyl-CoA synthetase (AMP-forming)/AMP-acid ligase II
MLGSFRPRPLPAELGARWLADGSWTDESLGQLIDRGLRAASDEPFTIRSAMRPTTSTLGEVHADALALAAGLVDLGVGPGDVVSFQLPNWIEAAHVFYAAALVGAAVMPIVHFYGAREVGYILQRTPPKAFVTFDRFGALSGTKTLLSSGAPLPELVAVVGDDLSGFEPLDAWYSPEKLEAPLAADADGPALIAYTSGTTADPKGVVHSHRTIGCEVRQLAALQSAGGLANISGAPVGHGIGMLGALLIPVHQGRPIHLVDVWDPGAVLAQMVADGLSSGSGSTFFLTSLLDHPMFDPAVHAPLMPFVGLGGSTVPAAVSERAAGLGISIVRMYGSTEHPSTTGASHDDPEDKRLHTDGRILDGVELRIDDDGEICSRGADCFVGYTDPELTDAAFDDDGWYHTGDIGVLDDDGYLSITDRKKDIIIRGGENISALEVEEVLQRMPGVLECAVVAAPDARLGEHACAFVRGASPTLAEVQAAMADAGLAKQKWPEEVRAVDDFPRTASGKVQKFVLRQRLRDET